MEPTAAQKVFAIPELRCLIEYRFGGKIHPVALCIKTAATERIAQYGHPLAQGPIARVQAAAAPSRTSLEHAWATEQYLRAEDDGSMYDAENITTHYSLYRLGQNLPAPGRGRFGLLRRPLSGATIRTGLAVDSRRQLYAGDGADCHSSLWWNWVPLTGNHENAPGAAPGTLALLQARLLPDIADIIRSRIEVPVVAKPCGVGLTVAYKKDKLIDLARYACPADAQPRPEWDKTRIVRHILAN